MYHFCYGNLFGRRIVSGFLSLFVRYLTDVDAALGVRRGDEVCSGRLPALNGFVQGGLAVGVLQGGIGAMIWKRKKDWNHMLLKNCKASKGMRSR